MNIIGVILFFFFLSLPKISSNGLISFERDYIDFVPSFFPINDTVLSPYWDDIDLSSTGSILFELYDSNKSKNLFTILDYMNNLTRPDQGFQAVSATVVHWLSVCPFGFENCLKVSDSIRL